MTRKGKNGSARIQDVISGNGFPECSFGNLIPVFRILPYTIANAGLCCTMRSLITLTRFAKNGL